TTPPSPACGSHHRQMVDGTSVDVQPNHPPRGRGGYQETAPAKKTSNPLAVATIARWWMGLR
ncbi:MAG: hypothetical protein ACKN81_05650, partial [Pirellulaceae bacterium]